MRQYLEFRGYEVAVAGSGEAAMDAIGTGGAYDVVITDLQLPGIRGEELAQLVLARMERTPKLIALSGENQHGDFGPFDLRLRKPCRPKALVEAICELLGAPPG